MGIDSPMYHEGYPDSENWNSEASLLDSPKDPIDNPFPTPEDSRSALSEHPTPVDSGPTSTSEITDSHQRNLVSGDTFVTSEYQSVDFPRADNSCVPQSSAQDSQCGSIYNCPFPTCAASYRRKADLKRHAKIHDPEEPIWHCGCCINKEDINGYTPNTRRDKMVQHIRNKHTSNLEKSLPCQEPSCSNQDRYLFTSESCLLHHLIHFHQKNDLIDAQGPLANPGGPDRLREDTSLSTQHDCCSLTQTSVTKSASRKRHIQSENKSVAKKTRHQFFPNSFLFSPYNPQPLCELGISDNLIDLTPTNDNSITLLQGNDVFDTHFDWTPAHMSSNMSSYISSDMSSHTSSDIGIGGSSLYGAPELTPYEPISAAFFPSPLADISLGTSYTRPLSSIEVPDIHPADFLAISRIKGFLNIENELASYLKLLQTANWDIITYNIKKETVTLRGDAIAVKIAKDKLQNMMREFTKKALYRCWLGQQAATQQAITFKPPGRLSKKLPPKENYMNSPRNRFVISVKQDKSFVDLWNNSLLPSLPGILDEYLGLQYTANLIRRGTTKSSYPVIEVRCLYVPGIQAQEYIEEKVDRICDANSCNRIPLLFLCSSPELLADTSCKEDNLQEHHKVQCKFSFTRPCKTPGMGASIGLLCSRRVSATLGGYVLIDGDKFILTAEHFVAKSQEIAKNVDPSPKVTSPSLSDLAEMKASLQQIYNEGRTNLKTAMHKKFGDCDISSRDIDEPDLDPQLLASSNACVASLLTTVEKPDGEFIIGKVAHRCMENRKIVVPGFQDSKGLYKMDWCLIEVNDRAGENRHRYQSNADAIAEDYSSESTTGLLCEETCDPIPNAKVHYVGRQSCHRSGLVNGTPLLRRDGDDPPVHELTIQSSSLVSGSEQVEGDSGAWIIHTNTDRVMGQLNGYNGGDITFTPIGGIFADIKEIIGAKEIHLPRSPNHQNPPMHGASSQTEMTCCIKPDVLPQPPRYDFLNPASNIAKMKPLSRVLRAATRSKESDLFAMEPLRINAQIQLRQANHNRVNRPKISSGSLQKLIPIDHGKAMPLLTVAVNKWASQIMRCRVELKRKSSTWPSIKQNTIWLRLSGGDSKVGS